MKNDSDGVPEYISEQPVIPRTTSEDRTQPMMLLDHRVVRQDGPPEVWDDDTDVDFENDTIVFDVRWAS